MKTAISLPDETFDAVTKKAQVLGISRSEFFATAARRYLDDLDGEAVTAQINHVLATAGADDSAEVAVAAARHLFANDESW